MRKIEDWIEAYCHLHRKSEAPPQYHRWAAIWIISAALERKAWLEDGHIKTYPNFFIILVGPPATYKSTTCDLAQKMLDNVPDLHYGPSMGSFQSIMEFIPTCEKTTYHKGETFKHQSMSLISPDWTNLTGNQDLEQCNALGELFDCKDKYDKWTKTNGKDSLRNYYMTLLGGSTQGQIESLIPTMAIGGGFSSRHIFVVGYVDPKNRTKRHKTSKADKALWGKLAHDLANMNEYIIGEFEMTKEFLALYDKWHMVGQDERLISDPRFEFYYGRKHKHLLSLSIIMSASRDNDMKLRDTDFTDALKLLNDTELTMPEALGGFGTSKLAPLIDKIKTILKSTSIVGVPMWSLGLQTQSDATAAELMAALKQMESNKLISEVDFGVDENGKEEMGWSWNFDAKTLKRYLDDLVKKNEKPPKEVTEIKEF